jgi:hypothetical protein
MFQVFPQGPFGHLSLRRAEGSLHTSHVSKQTSFKAQKNGYHLRDKEFVLCFKVRLQAFKFIKNLIAKTVSDKMQFIS